MKSLKITNGSGAAILAFVFLTNAYSVMAGGVAGRDVWISHLISGALAIAVLLGLMYLCDRFPEKSFYEVLATLLGKRLAKLFAVVFTFLSLLTCTVSLTVFSRFVQITALPQTPQIIIPTLIIYAAAFFLRSCLRSASGSARMLIWFFCGVFVLYALLGIGDIRLSLLSPVLSCPRTLFSGAGEIYLNRFATLPALMAVYTRIPKGKKRRRYFLTASVLSIAALCVISFVTIATLGAETAVKDFYPVISVMSVRGMGGFIRHTEIFACIAMTFSLFFKSSVCLLFSDDMLSEMFKAPRHSGVCLPLALICASSTQIIYKDISALRGMVEWKREAVYVLALHIVMPLLLVLVAAVRRKAH